MARMIPCISQVTTLPASFAEDVANAAASGFAGLEIWLTKLEQHLTTNNAENTAKLLADSGLKLCAAAYQGGLLSSSQEQRSVHLAHFRNRLELCQRFGIPTMILSADFTESVSARSLDHSLKHLVEAARWSDGFGVKLAIEFQGGGTFCNCLDTAIALVRQCGEPNLGICLDLFHYYKGPSKFEELNRLSPTNLAHVQVCDVAGVPRELMCDSDRIMPGDGDFQLTPILRRIREIGYTGGISLELMNPVLWQIDGATLAETGQQSLDRLLRSIE